MKTSEFMVRRDSGQRVVLECQEVAKSYGRTEVLASLTFEVRAGEILGLLGPNGAGKTTAIRVLTTILPASTGHFTIMGVPDSCPQRIRSLIGVLPESNSFPTTMTGLEFLTYMGQLYAQPRAEAEARGTRLLRVSGLDPASRAPIATYSRGMKQRLGIGRSLINDPRILFLDEPTLGFDPQGQREMLQAIRHAADVDKVAVLLCSHQLDVVEAVCHRVLILNHGRVVADGAVSDIKRQVAVPHTCRIRTAAEDVPDALSVLWAMTGVTAERHAHRKDELIISVPGTSFDGETNAVLQQLILAGVPIVAFSRESVGFSDAFLSVTESVHA